jgi:hypothetical protein
MKTRDVLELNRERKLVAKIYSSNRENTILLRARSTELDERVRKLSALWEGDGRISHDRESDFAILLRAVTTTKAEYTGLIVERLNEWQPLQQLRSETSQRDLAAMLALYKKLRAFGEMEEQELPRLQVSLQKYEEAVNKLEEFVGGVMEDSDFDR